MRIRLLLLDAVFHEEKSLRVIGTAVECRARNCLPFRLVPLAAGLDIQAEEGAGNPHICCCLKVPDNAAADENIVLAALAGGHIQVRHTRPEVASFTAHGESPGELHIESDACLQYACGSSCFARVYSSKHKLGTFAEMAEPATKADPR